MLADPSEISGDDAPPAFAQVDGLRETEANYSEIATVRRLRVLQPRAELFVSADNWPSATALATEALKLAPGRRSVRVVLCGPRPGGDLAGFRSWIVDGDGWTADGHYLASLTVPVLRYKRDGRTVEMLRAATWLGPTRGDTARPDEVREAMERCGEAIRRQFPGSVMLATPATTGRELLVRSLPEGAVWPVLPPELQTLVRSTATQGRIEPLLAPGRHGGLYAYDGRLMYAALTRRLPGGRWRHGSGPLPGGRCQPKGCGSCRHHGGTSGEACPYRAGRYRVTFRVPPGWAHVGILPALGPDGWSWPSEPGTVHEGWVDGAELHLAHEHGWSVAVHEWIVWDGYDETGPLDSWTRLLVTAHDKLHGNDLAAAAVRAIILHGIGAFHGRGHLVSHHTAWVDAHEVPATAVAIRPEDDGLSWHEDRGTAWPELAHPEWSSAVWARCRARMTREALKLPREQVAAIDTDCLHLTAPATFQDNGKPGAFRLKRRMPLPIEYAGGGINEVRALYTGGADTDAEHEQADVAAAREAVAAIRQTLRRTNA